MQKFVNWLIIDVTSSTRRNFPNVIDVLVSTGQNKQEAVKKIEVFVLLI